MEEILASIRRIIEDSDNGRKQPIEADSLSQDLEPASGEAPTADVDAFRADLHAAPEVRKPAALAEAVVSSPEPMIARLDASPRPEPAPVKASLTLAEVSARIAAEPVSAKVSSPAAPETGATSDAIIADWRREIAAVGEQAKAIPDRSIRKPVAEPEARPSDPVAEPVFERTFSIGAQGDAAEARAAAAETLAARPAIVSEHTGRQVAAAFGELSDAVASRGKKTFDEMAEEMLRPMLQDWLDNNLPTLVERLVREEIERVARGAQ